MRRVRVCSWRESLKLVGQLARNHRAAVGQLDGSKQVAALVGARAPARILEPPCRPAPSTLPLEPKRESLRAITRLPSNLISSQPGPDGGLSASAGLHGRMKPSGLERDRSGRET